MIVHPTSAHGTGGRQVEATFVDDEPPGRVTAVLIGLVGLVGVICFGSIVGIPHVERHLQSDVERNALQGAAEVDVSFDGRIAVLSGFVRSSDERRAVIDRVARRWGVSRVDADGLAERARARSGPALPPSRIAGASKLRRSRPPSVLSTEVASRATAPSPVSTVSISPVAPPTTVVVDEAAVAGLETELASIRRSAPITFARSSPTLLTSAQPTLDRIAAALAKTPLPIRIEAHTDASGDPGRNAVLSAQRAEAVRAALILRGVNPSIVSAVGRGESSPIATNTSASGRERNRRVEFVVIRPVAT